ncbi:hypothetical protein IB642_03790 [Allofrancisella guangzhouensis]|uniref:NIF system FeS cluster assembly NifU N-terminal domain-containing protein n=1 Tax=Allofrancisella guangzhouensis TaxID=594679 RepID=A0A0A8E4P5_9GAMM|nr:hypothetical protein [Allofrancisella guangzhouensis]AJC48983.1 hypothetical protein SD28_04705 [Allofrancisella guangzhouensis]MBK2027888.1 hypothetical protein [Allofrancisella guangzhouensis]MBK2044141.1 hypothetical protein [Allofrancisella guangzhouensis]MBK2045121.1 hypothetical protein [Allofrancisella guangzhouensis]
MYNSLIKEMLTKLSKEDAEILPTQIRYKVGDSFSTVEVYISKERISFKVFGDAYIVAMVKWLQLRLQGGENIEKISIEYLIELFELPEVKYRNAIQLIELIEKLNER